MAKKICIRRVTVFLQPLIEEALEFLVFADAVGDLVGPVDARHKPDGGGPSFDFDKSNNGNETSLNKVRANSWKHLYGRSNLAKRSIQLHILTNTVQPRLFPGENGNSLQLLLYCTIHLSSTSSPRRLSPTSLTIKPPGTTSSSVATMLV